LSATAVNVRSDFPVLDREGLVYLDSAATSQKPRQVIEAIDSYYRNSNANIHRSMHELASEATELYEGGRARVAAFIGARPEEVVFVRNATEAINLVRYTWAREQIGAGDTVAITRMEHHSNVVPWQLLCAERDARLAEQAAERRTRFAEREAEAAAANPELAAQLEQARHEKERALDAQDFERAASVHQEALALRRRLLGRPEPVSSYQAISWSAATGFNDLRSVRRMERRFATYPSARPRAAVALLLAGAAVFAVGLGFGIALGWLIWM